VLHVSAGCGIGALTCASAIASTACPGVMSDPRRSDRQVSKAYETTSGPGSTSPGNRAQRAG
jgi:hypothetical protein